MLIRGVAADEKSPFTMAKVKIKKTRILGLSCLKSLNCFESKYNYGTFKHYIINANLSQCTSIPTRIGVRKDSSKLYTSKYLSAFFHSWGQVQIVLGSTHILQKFSFSLFPSILTFDFDSILA